MLIQSKDKLGFLNVLTYGYITYNNSNTKTIVEEKKLINYDSKCYEFTIIAAKHKVGLDDKDEPKLEYQVVKCVYFERKRNKILNATIKNLQKGTFLLIGGTVNLERNEQDRYLNVEFVISPGALYEGKVIPGKIADRIVYEDVVNNTDKNTPKF